MNTLDRYTFLKSQLVGKSIQVLTTTVFHEGNRTTSFKYNLSPYGPIKSQLLKRQSSAILPDDLIKKRM